MVGVNGRCRTADEDGVGDELLQPGRRPEYTVELGMFRATWVDISFPIWTRFRGTSTAPGPPMLRQWVSMKASTTGSP